MNTLATRLVVLSRWALVPLFFGLGVALLVLIPFFFVELGRFFAHLFSASQSQIIVDLLSLIDLVLIASLMIIVIYSGYENFVQTIDVSDAEGAPKWMSSISFSGLKQKLFASMMAIAGITLLKALMKLETDVSETQVKWLAIANIIFLVAYAVLAFSDRFSAYGSGEKQVD